MDAKKELKTPPLDELYPGRSPEELANIQRNLQRYLEIVGQIYGHHSHISIDRKQLGR
ncbi:MAG: hypothetical protein IPM59_03555 [Chloracidobacterium sp.]|nr:hypothetical protein [Chloracidobacterium sp.]